MFSRPPLPKRFVNPCLPSGASFTALSAVLRRVLVIASSQHLPARKLWELWLGVWEFELGKSRAAVAHLPGKRGKVAWGEACLLPP